VTNKWVYSFDEIEQAEKHVGDDWDQVRGLLGGKGANLGEMTRIGIPVPAGFTVTTEACNVGRLMRLAIAEAREVRSDIPIGICGEHGGDPASIAFCHELGLSYVSCSPFRVPVARLAAAQAALSARVSRESPDGP